MSKITLYTWVRERRNKKRYPGTGAMTAYEEGAKARLRNDHYSPYHRTDCFNAWEDGWSEMNIELSKGTIIICSCCGSKIKE